MIIGIDRPSAPIALPPNFAIIRLVMRYEKFKVIY